MPTCGTSARLSAASGENKKKTLVMFRAADEQMLASVRDTIRQLHESAPDSIGDRRAFQLISCTGGGWKYQSQHRGIVLSQTHENGTLRMETLTKKSLENLKIMLAFSGRMC